MSVPRRSVLLLFPCRHKGPPHCCCHRYTGLCIAHAAKTAPAPSEPPTSSEPHCDPPKGAKTHLFPCCPYLSAVLTSLPPPASLLHLLEPPCRPRLLAALTFLSPMPPCCPRLFAVLTSLPQPASLPHLPPSRPCLLAAPASLLPLPPCCPRLPAALASLPHLLQETALPPASPCTCLLAAPAAVQATQGSRATARARAPWRSSAQGHPSHTTRWRRC